ncbi:carboxypeptidase regulatory-like domain-containing protein [Aestuariibacter sp. AA17]|uniref:Carboxypeptidase regulatory-like domain-containing protein n=1 Tax=Fluctibacter corallii TaxID=2984329 RepID=A0ABT3A7U6_9ALTE|nr:TonB-dependent receptor [Aestuariibacter sp. AA17]MCV2884753.1 carboxypeptidase regulatory-like domain-containing protein [Aestuariibacter sp. AA17]
MFGKTKLNRIALAVAMSVGMTASAMAQDTSSSIRGTITTPQGTPAADTTITIIHEPTGSSRTITTNEFGGFQARGLRVGGPYKVIIDSKTYRDQQIEGLFLQLGETERLNTQLQSDNVENIVVTGSMPSFSSTASSGFYGEDAIRSAASLTRDIKDVVRANPLVTVLPGAEAEMTIAGSNPRFNSITVDGIGQNDDFGLNGGGYPTQRSPLPLDALDQVTVDVAPFDAKVSGFSGGIVNAVFKSGTNEFTGSVFYEKLDSDWGGTPRNEGKDIEIEFEEETYGFTLGGPIIKDKLFFFGAYEFYEAPNSLDWGPAGSGAPNVTDATLEEVNEVIRIAKSVYGLTDEQIGTYSGSPVEEDEKWVAKIDWNINDDHRASFTYQFNEGNRTRNTTDRDDTLRLSSQWYNVTETLNNYSVKLYSNWTDDFSSELSVTKKDVENRQASFGSTASFSVDNLASGGDIDFGADPFRHANQLDTETLNVKGDFTYLIGEHSLEFGFEYQDVDFANIFVPYSKGVVVFDGLENFENRIADDYRYENGSGNNPENAAAIFTRKTTSLYVQDSFELMEDLNVRFGLRYERMTSSDKPPYNANHFARTGYDNTENLDGIDIILPRADFTYYLSDDVTLRGGVGRFAGGQPNVWISNAYSDNGVNVGRYRDRTGLTVPDSIGTEILREAFSAVQNAQGDGNVSFNDPNFELPNDWRYQLAVDYIVDIPFLGEDYSWTTEFLHIDRKDAAFWVDASLSPSDAVGTTADGGRIIFDDSDEQYGLMLTNAADGGRSNILTTMLSKSWDNGVSFSTSYTHQDITEVNPGTNSTARSNYRFSPSVNKNIAADHMGTGNFEVEHRFVINLGYSTELFDGYRTDINLFFERRSGESISYVLDRNRDVFFDSFSPGFDNGNFLPYIPTANDDNVVYQQITEEEVLAYIDERGLSSYAGGYVPKNSEKTPWVNRMDLSFTQQIPGIMNDHKGEFYFVIENMLNLIDSSQGKVYDSEFGTYRLYSIGDLDAQNRYTITGLKDDTANFNAEESAWKIKVGVKYVF